MIHRSSKVVYKSETMAAREEIDIDNQEDMTQYSDEQIPGNSQIEDISGENSNKEVMNMMHAMFSKLEENMEKMNNKLDENQVKMSNKLDEKINEYQKNLKISMINSIKGSVDKNKNSLYGNCIDWYYYIH